MRTNIHKELDIWQTGNLSNLCDIETILNAAGIFGILANRHRDRWRTIELLEPVECSVRLSYAEIDVAPVNFAARGHLRQHVEQEVGAPEQHSMANPESIPFLDDPTEHISAKLLTHMLAAISHPSYKITSPLIGPTITATLKLIHQENLPPSLDFSSTKEWAPKPQTQDRLLALSLDLWALTQVIVSGPKDWRISLAASNILPENPSAQPNSTTAPEAELPASTGVLSQLKAAAEQRAALISRTDMIELEKRLERKERCQGFETFLVGILLLNCVERIGWAMMRVSVAEQQ
ncbi:MAG: hypothetical protein Q9212_004275, partial [Teloschistes hypoglaucus]